MENAPHRRYVYNEASPQTDELRTVCRVALKVIKLGMDTKSVIARFESERQALAMMDHPNIAKGSRCCAETWTGS